MKKTISLISIAIIILIGIVSQQNKKPQLTIHNKTQTAKVESYFENKINKKIENYNYKYSIETKPTEKYPIGITVYSNHKPTKKITFVKVTHKQLFYITKNSIADFKK